MAIVTSPAPIPASTVYLGAITSGPIITQAGTMAIGGVAIPGLQAWFRADKGITVTNAASWPAVASWADQSGLGSRDLTATGTPAWVKNSINGRPGIRTVPSTSYFSNTTTNLVTVDRGPRTVFFVGVGRSTAGGTHFCFRTGATNVVYFEHIFTGGNVACYGTPSSSPVLLSTVPAINNTPHCWEYSYDGQFATVGATETRIRVNIDGDEQAVNGGGGMGVAESSANAGFMIGANNAATSQAWDGEVSEVIAFNRNLNTVEKALIRAYLMAYYNIPSAASAANMVNVLALGDSNTGAVATGDAAVVAAGAWRSYVQSKKKNWNFSCGTVYNPTSALTGAVQTSPRAQDGLFNRCAGFTAFTSANNAAHGIGGKFLDDLLDVCGGAELVFLMIGVNDNVVDGLTAAQSATNIRAICEGIYTKLPNARVLLAAPTKLATFNASAGTANPIIAAIPAAIEANFATNPPANVIRNPVSGLYAMVPPTVPDANYASGGTDGTHIGVSGWQLVADQSWLPEISARNL